MNIGTTESVRTHMTKKNSKSKQNTAKKAAYVVRINYSALELHMLAALYLEVSE